MVVLWRVCGNLFRLVIGNRVKILRLVIAIWIGVMIFGSTGGLYGEESELGHYEKGVLFLIRAIIKEQRMSL